MGAPQQQDAFANGRSEGKETSFSGTLERITYFNEENHYTVARLSVEGSATPLTIVGNLVGANVGDMLEVTGGFKTHPKFGRQFEVKHFRAVLPTTIKGLEKYLGSGLIKGIGKKYAKSLVKHFGMDLLDVLENDIERIRQAPGIGPKRVESIKVAWEEQRAIRGLMVFMQEFDIPLTHASRIYRQYGDQAALILRNNPYQLALDIKGIGFHTADQMGARLNIAKDSPHRLDAGILHLLHTLADDGHCFFPYELLTGKALELLELDDETLINQSLKRLHEAEKLKLEKLPDEVKAVYLHWLWRHETGVSERLAQLLRTGKTMPKIDIPNEIASFEERFKFKLAEQQQRAVELALKGGALIVTGGPGTGKTTLLRAIIDILGNKGVSMQLAAPTGRAAKRLAETTRMKASTIHRLLKFNPRQGGFEVNADNSLRTQLLVIDEASMLDVTLAHNLLSAVLPTTSVLFVGDIDQLPSVGAGNLLHDMIRSRTVPLVRLNVVFRQAQQSRIIVNAHRVNEGQMPLLDQDQAAQSDFFFTEKHEPAEIVRMIVMLVKERIPFKFGLRSIEDIQVITPMHRGMLGTQELNRELQAALNPRRQMLHRGGQSYCVGDKVMQLRNNYDKDVFNGDIGRIAELDEEEHRLYVEYDGRRVDYSYEELHELQLSYAITVHKSQGSEYPAVVMPVHTQHYLFLQRNLLYTAMTRGKRLVCLVGAKKALAMSVKNDQTRQRFTALSLRLEQALHG